MRDNSKYKNYLIDLASEFKFYALEAKSRYDEDKNDMYNCGYSTAFHRVMSYIVQQAETFDIELKELGLEDFDPDKDLIS